MLYTTLKRNHLSVYCTPLEVESAVRVDEDKRNSMLVMILDGNVYLTELLRYSRKLRSSSGRKNTALNHQDKPTVFQDKYDSIICMRNDIRVTSEKSALGRICPPTFTLQSLKSIIFESTHRASCRCHHGRVVKFVSAYCDSKEYLKWELEL